MAFAGLEPGRIFPDC